MSIFASPVSGGRVSVDKTGADGEAFRSARVNVLRSARKSNTTTPFVVAAAPKPFEDATLNSCVGDNDVLANGSETRTLTSLDNWRRHRYYESDTCENDNVPEQVTRQPLRAKLSSSRGRIENERDGGDNEPATNCHLEESDGLS